MNVKQRMENLLKRIENGEKESIEIIDEIMDLLPFRILADEDLVEEGSIYNENDYKLILHKKDDYYGVEDEDLKYTVRYIEDWHNVMNPSLLEFGDGEFDDAGYFHGKSMFDALYQLLCWLNKKVNEGDIRILETQSPKHFNFILCVDPME